MKADGAPPLMRISVYITSYNQCSYLREAIDSVLAQTLRPHEIIVVDDASTDGSPALIRDYAARHPELIRPIFHARNLGVAATRRDALSAVTGDCVTYVDGDDRMLPAKLEREAAALVLHPDAQAAFSNHYNITADGQRLDTWVKPGDVVPTGDIFVPVFTRDFPGRDILRMELVRMQALRQVGFHDPALRTFEDFDLRLRLYKSCRACFVNEPLFEIRRHGLGLSATRADEKVATLGALYRRHADLLADLDGHTRAYVRMRYRGWVAVFARQAGHAALHDAHRGFLHRRLAALAHFVYVARYAPDRLTLGDLLCLVLPVRYAEKWI